MVPGGSPYRLAITLRVAAGVLLLLAALSILVVLVAVAVFRGEGVAVWAALSTLREPEQLLASAAAAAGLLGLSAALYVLGLERWARAALVIFHGAAAASLGAVPLVLYARWRGAAARGGSPWLLGLVGAAASLGLVTLWFCLHHRAAREAFWTRALPPRPLRCPLCDGVLSPADATCPRCDGDFSAFEAWLLVTGL